MKFSDQFTHSTPTDCRSNSSDDQASIKDLAQGTSDYLCAWSELFASEVRLAGVSAVRIVVAALVIPAIALGICMTFDALLIALLDRWLRDWPSCIAIVLLLDIAGLCALLVATRSWWRNMSMPRSRDALRQLLERFA